MNVNNAEKGEESLSSPVLSTSHSPSILASASFLTSKPECENDDHDMCSPVLNKKKAQNLRFKKPDSHQSHQSFSRNVSTPKELNPPFFQPKTETNTGENFEFEGLCSPELGTKQGNPENTDSPEVKTRKTHFNPAYIREKSIKYDMIMENKSNSEKNPSSFASTSSHFLSKQHYIGSSLGLENQWKLPKNSVKTLNFIKLDNIKENNLSNKSAEPEVETKKLNEISVFDEANFSFSLKRKKLTKEAMKSASDNNTAGTENFLESNVSTSPILKTKPLSFDKRKTELESNKKRIDQGIKCVILQNESSKRNLFVSQPCLNITKTIPDTNQNFDPRIFSFESKKSETQNSIGWKINSKFSSPSATYMPLTNAESNNPPHSLSPTNSLSPFAEKFLDFSQAVSSSNDINISSVRKKLHFHSRSIEKRRMKGVKPLHKLNLKKTNNLENQFSKFSEFCKSNTSLSTKSPSNLTIRKSKMKKFDSNKEELDFRKSSNHSENCCDFDRSSSPLLERMNSISKTDVAQVKLNVPKNEENSFKKYNSLEESEVNLSRHEHFFEDQVDDKSLSPCLRTPRNFAADTDSLKVGSKFFRFPEKSVKKFKFNVDVETVPSNNLGDGPKCDDLNESLSPILEVRKNLVTESDHKAVPCNIDEDYEDSHTNQIHDVTLVNVNDECLLDDKQILNDTISERNQEMVDSGSQLNVSVDDEMISSQMAGAIFKNDKGSLTIEFSESSGTQQSRISDGNLPCDNIKESLGKIPETPQKNLPSNDDDIYESGKKRKRRYKNGTLSARLNKLLNRMRSETRMWAHEEQSDVSTSAAINLVVDIVAYEMNKWLLKCSMISEPVTDSCCDVYFVILHPNTIGNALVSPGIVLRVFPKWQTLELSSPKVTVIFNITRVKLIQDSCSMYSQNLVPGVKQNIQVAEAHCSCQRDSILSTCVHNLLRRKVLLGPLISSENGQ